MQTALRVITRAMAKVPPSLLSVTQFDNPISLNGISQPVSIACKLYTRASQSKS